MRELEHTVEAALNVLGDEGSLSLEHLPAYLTMRETPEVHAASEPAPEPAPELPTSAVLPLTEAIEQYERQLITQALAACHGKIVAAATLLKIPRTTLQYKLEKYHLPKK